MLSAELEPLAKARILALARGAPSDSLMAWLLEHAPCALKLPDALILQPEHDVIDAWCRYCGAHGDLSTALQETETTPTRWWLLCGMGCVARHWGVLVARDGKLNAEFYRCIEAVEGAVLRCAALSEEGPSTGIH